MNLIFFFKINIILWRAIASPISYAALLLDVFITTPCSIQSLSIISGIIDIASGVLKASKDEFKKVIKYKCHTFIKLYILYKNICIKYV